MAGDLFEHDAQGGASAGSAGGHAGRADELCFIEEQPVSGRVVPARPGQGIGRDECDIVTPDPEVSRRHATLVQTAGGLAILDEGSLNGTFVNGTRATGAVPLRAGDVVQLGNTVWRVASMAEASAAAQALR